MKKFLTILALLLVPSVAMAKAGSRNLDSETKRIERCFPVSVFTAGTDTDPGSVGVLQTQALNSGPAAYTLTTFHSMPYAARVGVNVNDVNANDTNLTCAAPILLTGLTVDGRIVTESLGAINETTVLSTNVFQRIDRLSTGSCGDGTDANDLLSVFTSEHAWVGKKIRADADVVSACTVSAANVINCGTAATIAAAVTPSNSTINILTAGTFDGAVAADAEVLCIATVPSF